jgi:iron complex transport system ATP-binding protein
VKLRIDAVRVVLGGHVVVDEATVLVAPGEVAGLIGPNGSGKSSLLRTVYRHLRPAAGSVHADERDVWTSPPRQAATWIAAVPQETRSEFDITAWDMVAMGRNPHKGTFAVDTAADREIVADALHQVGLTELADRHFATLSGGERQRVLLARALTQRTPVLVLDEPTNHLDIRHQHELLGLVRQLGLTTLTALHDLNLAAAYCDRIHVLRAGHVVASGTPDEVLTADLVDEVFEIAAEVFTHPRTGRPHLLFAPVEPARVDHARSDHVRADHVRADHGGADGGH